MDNLDQMMVQTAVGGWLCPLGYAAKVDDWVEVQMRTWSSVLLLDIRLKARSRWYPEWNKSALQARWGERYIHEKRLGNVNYQYTDRPIELLDPEGALPWVIDRLQQNELILLVCACREYDRCHRKTVLSYILQRCQDIKRSSGMRFDVGRGMYVGVCSPCDFAQNVYIDLSYVLPPPEHSLQVCVAPQVFEQFRLVVDPDMLYEVQFWVMMAEEVPSLATFEPVSGGVPYGV